MVAKMRNAVSQPLYRSNQVRYDLSFITEPHAHCLDCPTDSHYMEINPSPFVSVEFRKSANSFPP